MPRYDYRCQDCGETFTVRASMSEYSAGLAPSCSACGSTQVERSFRSVNVLTGSRSTSGTSFGSSCGSGGFT